MSPVSGGTCQPDIITVGTPSGTPTTTSASISEGARGRGGLRRLHEGLHPPAGGDDCVSPEITFSPLPGGALTANTQMLRDNNLMDKYPAIVEAMAETVARSGYGTSVTPVSQFYFQQAFNNVMFGPWKKIADGYGKMVLGYFGKTPVAPTRRSSRRVRRPWASSLHREVVDINDKDTPRA